MHPELSALIPYKKPVPKASSHAVCASISYRGTMVRKMGRQMRGGISDSQQNSHAASWVIEEIIGAASTFASLIFLTIIPELSVSIISPPRYS